ncbi:hypothetical protein CIN_14590 [Commensalibacter intestini A911]|uniref:AbiTii domain-containing protein n=1 Tax=Commensalibacter intestini A911 TaxID=1088868 RepID=G6F1G3_9PROT|nr:hypothetical protein [Commensalibacter intestini]EHD13267.1 hypothetical protein CIN_14590 [Commensalibacter intestini A911]
MKAIIELQKQAMDSSTDIVELVKYAYAIACKLDLQDFADWCNAELEGYTEHCEVSLPEYRCVDGTLKVSSMNGRTERYSFSDADKTSRLSRMGFPNDISSLIKIIEGAEQGKWISAKLSPKLEQSIVDDPEYIFAIEAYLEVHISELEKIFSKIRKIILDWTLNCEKQGVLGDEWIFTDKEKAMAQNITYNIGLVQNMANHNTESTINQTAQNISVTKGDLQSLVNFLSDKGISKSEIQEFKEIIDIEPNITVDGIQNSKIQQWLGKIAVGGSLVAKGVAIDVIVEAIKQFF